MTSQIKVDIGNDSWKKLTTDLERQLEKRMPDLLEQIKDKVVESIRVKSGGEIEIHSIIDNTEQTIKISGLGPKVEQVERLRHPFEYTRNELPSLLGKLSW